MKVTRECADVLGDSVFRVLEVRYCKSFVPSPLPCPAPYPALFLVTIVRVHLASTYYKSTCHIFFQLLDTLPVCQDFNRQVCNRPACKFIHLSDGNVEVIENRVTVCRDAVKGACMRPQCKYYHIPVALPPAPLMAITSPGTP
ncbi:Muscleblind-like protein 2 [Dufourea novaeangliae]|uniref:Muscleblind-like protein 2 n=1 Tax=Dufourea novaeangliae TaxID=178035 RepID=A0A154PHS7_DUFNO|nr:Muscleblind-like protein 2 [Dufourea novaeangliae]